MFVAGCLVALHRLSKGLTLSSCNTSFVRAMSYVFKEVGEQNTTNYSGYFATADGYISPFHDIPLHANEQTRYCPIDFQKTLFNMVVEIPRWTNAKMEINLASPLNPIKQDIKKGKLRYVKNVFPYHGYIWNYGALPQTWEDPNAKDPHTNYNGDNDPIDVCEIGTMVAYRGEVKQVKVLGVMALIDEGETDWKVIAIDSKDPLAPKLNDIGDVDTYMPGLLQATHEWLKIYKIPTGKPENVFAFDGQAKDKAFALKIIDECNNHWKKLIVDSPKESSIDCSNTTLKNASTVSYPEAKKIAEEIPPGAGNEGEISPDVHKWHFVKHG